LNNKLGWDESVLLMRDQLFSYDLTLSVSLHWFSLVSKNSEKISICIISVAGFGRRMALKEQKVVPPGHLMALETFMRIITSYVIQRLLLPDWVMGMTTMTSKIDVGFKEIKISSFPVNNDVVKM
jgi:hypothetical protein